MRRPVAATFTLAALVMSSPAHAEELWVGVYAHDVTPISATEFESGVDVQLGWRGKAFEALGSIGRPAPYAFVGVNAGSGTDYAAAGLNWRWGSSVYVGPGIGIAIHDGHLYAVRKGRRVALASRVLFGHQLPVGMK